MFFSAKYSGYPGGFVVVLLLTKTAGWRCLMEKQRCIKTDEITVNMLVHALRDVFRQENEKGMPVEVTRNLILRLAYHEGKKLFLDEEEYKKAVQALNGLRDVFIQAGRYTDGIDVVLMRVMRSKYKRCAVR